MALDLAEIKILTLLQNDARVTNQELADNVGMSASPCWRKVRRLEEDNVILGYRAVLNRKKIGLGVMVFIRVVIDSHSEAEAKKFEAEVQTFIDLSNDSLAVNWGYSPVTQAEVNAMARDLKPLLHPKAVLFAVDRDERAIGFAIALPDVNKLIKGVNGRLFPVGLIRLLTGLPKLRQYRMFALGVIPEYHGKGIDSLIYRALYESCYSPDVRMEINYILEDNYPMNNAVVKLGAKPLRRYRVYQKSIS